MTSTDPALAAFQSDAANPLLGTWSAPHETPPFAAIRPEHFRPAFDHAMAEHMAEIEAIAAAPEPASFANTIAALERSGRALDRGFPRYSHALAGAHTNDALMAIEREMSPLLAAHRNRIHLHDGLYARIKALWDRRAELGLSPEQARVLERYDVTFRRAGAGLPAAAKRRHRRDRRAAGGARHRLQPERAGGRAGLCAGARRRGGPCRPERGRPRGGERRRRRARHAGKHVITLARSSVEPFLQSSARRDLREKAYAAWIARGNGGGATDNKAIIAETIGLRAERARLIGYPTFADYRLDDAMAKTPQAVQALLERVWSPARGPRHGGSRRPAGAGAARRRQFRPRGLRLALLRREAAQGALRHRRRRDRPLSRARQRDPGGLRHRPAAVRPVVPRAARRAGVASRRPGVGGHRRRTAGSRACSSATISPALASAAAPG